jgi:PTH1 family peptidyl-tRNA hydrolase
MKLIVGLGNPEQRYANTRHNIGFYILDEFARCHGTNFQPKDKFKSHVAEYEAHGEKILLLKPMTYYNQSGEAVRAIIDFYKIDPSEILVVHDELALPLGTIRTRFGGSDAGNNGVKSISQHVGADTTRLRIGVYTEHRDLMDDADYVLGKFSGDEKKILSKVEPKIHEAIGSFVDGSFVDTTHKT